MFTCTTRLLLSVMPAGILMMVLVSAFPPTPYSSVIPTIPPTATTVPAGTSNEVWVPVGQTFEGVELVFVPAGCFEMGSELGEDDERPLHEICLNSFWIGRTEITNEDYAECVETGPCSPPHEISYYGDPAYAEHPVVFVDWFQAVEYASWLGCALPTEAQWEYAARGPEGLLFPWGNEFDGARLNACDANCRYTWRNTDYDDGYAGSAPVGSFPEGMSWVGAFDMLGNVWEWVADWYTPDYYATSTSDRVNPVGPELGWGKVVRGGSWASHSVYTRTASRDCDTPQLRFLVVGFRIVCLMQTAQHQNAPEASRWEWLNPMDIGYDSRPH
jgi:formylglycine-generating enzyme required for sulfatase activity